ncbi:MAG: tripartite tricarboxylate transporter substrate binding protein, partial [Oxalobacteraceae bacterium]
MPTISASRRRTLTAAVLGVGLAGFGFTTGARAQSDMPLRLVVPFSAGGTADVLPRIVADKLHDAFPGGAIVDNRPGAGGNIGADAVFRAKP